MAALFVAVFAILLTTFLWTISWLSYRNLPPGPRPWPVVGNLLQTHNRLALLRKYGPVFTLWMGPKPLIIISGAEEMREALLNRADVFSQRPCLYSSYYVTCNYKTITSSSGPQWRALRRNLVSEVLQPVRVKSYKPVRDREFQALVDIITEEARNNDGVVPVLRLVRKTSFNILITMCIGQRLEDDVFTEFDEIMRKRMGTLGLSLANFFFVFRLFDWGKKGKEVQKRTDVLLQPYLDKVREAIKNNQPVSGRYSEVLLKMQASSGSDADRMTDSQIAALCAEIINAGTDTTGNTVEWIMARLICEPRVQQKLAEELDRVLGARKIDESDVENLPYLQAVVLEGLRVHAPSVGSLPYAVSKAGVKFRGYEIPTNAIISFGYKSISSDPNIWGDPQNFRPERFEKEMTNVDLTGTKQMVLIPFGIGKHICPGLNVAILHLYMFVGMLVQTFEWSNAVPGLPDLTEISNPLPSLKTPLRARIRERRVTSISTST